MFLKEIYYYLKYPGTRLYARSKKLDVLLIYFNEIGIKSTKVDYGYYLIIFNDDTQLKMWNENRWFAWMSSGSLTLKNGKNFEWNTCMPSYETLYHYMRYIKSIEPKEEKILKHSEDYSEYLPLRVVRKLKLKKLK